MYISEKINAQAFFGPFVSKDRTVPGCKRFITYIGIPWIKGKLKRNVVIIGSEVFLEGRGYQSSESHLQSGVVTFIYWFKTHGQRARGRFTQMSSIELEYSSQTQFLIENQCKHGIYSKGNQCHFKYLHYSNICPK